MTGIEEFIAAAAATAGEAGAAGGAAGGLAAGAGEIGAGLGTLGAEATGVGAAIGETGAAAGLGGAGFGAGFGAGATGLGSAFGASSSILGDIGQGAAQGVGTTLGKDIITGQPVTPQGIATGALTGGAGGGFSSALGGVGAGAGGAAPPVGSGIDIGPLGLGDAPASGSSVFEGAANSGVIQTPGISAPSGSATGVLDPTTTNAVGQHIGDLSGGTSLPSGTPDNFANALTFGKDNANWLIPAAGLGYAALKGNQPLPGEGQLNAAAGRLDAQGQQLQSYLQTGTLPPGVSQSLTQAGDAAKAAIRSRHASAGTSGSSAEQQELASVGQTISGQGASIAMQMLQAGISESSLSSSLYAHIMDSALKEDQTLGAAIGGFAGSLTPGWGGQGGAFRIVPATAGAA